MQGGWRGGKRLGLEEISGQSDRGGVLDCSPRSLGEVAPGLKCAELGRLDEAVEKRRDLGSAQRSRSVVILAAKHHASQPAFGPIVIEGDARVVEKAREPEPQPTQIAEGLAEAALR